MLQKRPYARTARVAPSLQQGLAKILQSYYPVSQGDMLSVNAVELSKKLSFAKVFISIFYLQQKSAEDNRRKLEKYLSELNRQVPKIRHLLTSEIQLRCIPDLLFTHDETPEAAAKINSLLQRLT